MIIVTRINGVDDAGIFTFSFSFACMIQVIGYFAGRTYQVTERNENVNDSDYLKFKLFNVATMVLIGIIFSILRGYSPFKITVIMFLVAYKAIDAYAESIYGVFQRNNNLYQCGISMFLKGLLCMLIFIFVDIITKNLIITLIALLLTDVLIFIFYDIIHLKKYKLEFRKLTKKAFKILLIGGFSVFIFSFLIQYVINAQKYVIDFMMADSDQTIFGIVLMPATFMAICSLFIINPFLFDLNKSIKNKQYKIFRNIVRKVCLYVAAIGIIAIIACWFIGIPILNIIYSLQLEPYLIHLMLIVIGSVLYAIVSVLSNVLIALRKNTSQAIIYGIASLYTFIMSYVFIKYFGLIGASYAFITTMILLLLMYLVLYFFEVNKLSKE